MATTTPDEERERELRLVDNVDFKIISASNDTKKLQDVLTKFLAPLLLKAGSQHGAVRAKVTQIAMRLQTFIQPDGVVLPVEDLLKQFKSASDKFEPSIAALVMRLDMMFLQHSIRRIPPVKRRALISLVLQGMSKLRLNPLAPSLFNMFMKMLSSLNIPSRGSKEDEKFREVVGLNDPADARYVADMMGKLLRFNPTGTSSGLNKEALDQLTLGKPDTWTAGPANDNKPSLSLPETRIMVVNFLASGAFIDEERFMPALYAAAHTDSRVSSVGEDMLKRTTVSLEDPIIVGNLWLQYHALTVPYRIRILGLLSKSVWSTTWSADILRMVQETMVPEAGGRLPSAGLEKTKLFNALFSYINWVARSRHKDAVNTSWVTLMDNFRNYIQSQGWPNAKFGEEATQAGGSSQVDSSGMFMSQNPNTKKTTSHMEAKHAEELRLRAYESIGLLAKGAYMSLADRLDWVRWLFRSLSEDGTPNVAVSIDGALSSLMSAFDPAEIEKDTTNCEKLRELLLLNMELFDEDADAMTGIQGPAASSIPVRSTRHAVAKWANHCLPFSDVTARWIDILAIAGRRDERNEVTEEGRKGLDPWTYHGTSSTRPLLPQWHHMVFTYFMSGPNKLVTSKAKEEFDSQQSPTSSSSLPAIFSGDRTKAYPLALEFIKKILFLTALASFDIQPGWDRQLETLVVSDKKTRDQIRIYLQTTKPSDTLNYLKACFEGMQLEEHQDVVEKSARCFVEVASLCPKSVLGPLTERTGELVKLIKSNQKEIRAFGARAIGILNGHPSNPPDLRDQMLQSLFHTASNWKTAVGSELNYVEGAFLALGHALSRRVYYAETPTVEELTASLHMLPSPSDLAGAVPSLRDAVLDTLTQLWTAGIFGSPESSQTHTPEAYLKALATLAVKSNEHAITALGRLAIVIKDQKEGESESDGDLLPSILEKLYTLHEIKQAEVHFTIGEAIVAAVACWDSDIVQLTLDVEPNAGSGLEHKRSSRIETVLEKILTDSKTTKPSLLKASGIWLFCLIQHCSHLPEIQARLRECQVAFMRLLAARDELVQETASRGLSLVYEKGDPELKDALVKDLVSSFTGSGPQLKVDDDTELFDAGALPTGDGKSVTSYKDIVNLANEVGDQTLIYKFMSLATNAATWATRSAFGRFGLSNILSESEVDPKLYPKLYRYRFDPNQNVQRSMNDIWKAMVKDSNAVIEKHFNAIMEDLLKSIVGKEWRVRQASCAAIADLVQGRPFPVYEKYYAEIWTKALKVLDDVKDSVRGAAIKLCIGLSNTLVRQLEEGTFKSASTAMMKEAVPFLTSEKGIESSVEDVKIFCTITVMKIAKHGGKALRPFIGKLVPRLLNLLSTIEHQGVNYAYLRASTEDREKIDKARNAAVAQSPISEAIEDCLRNVDADIMAELKQGLVETMKSAIGTQTKLGCARVLSTLARQHAADFRPYASAFLDVLKKQALSTNDEVSNAYAKAAAYVIRVSDLDSVLAFLQYFIKLYFNAENEGRRQKIADVVLSLSKISPDNFKDVETTLMPFTYLAKHDTDDYVSKALSKVWESHAGSSLTVANYVKEITALAKQSLDTAQWALKHAGALTIASLALAVTKASDLSGHVDTNTLTTIWPVFEPALALKTFAGKERLLEAFSAFVAVNTPLWRTNPEYDVVFKKIAIREAKRNNDEYRIHAFKALWKFAEARTSVDMLQEIVDIVLPFLTDLTDEDKMDIDKDKKKEEMAQRLAEAALEAIARGYPRGKVLKSPYPVVAEIMRILKPYIESPKCAFVKRKVWYTCVYDLMKYATEHQSVPDSVDGGGHVALEYYWSLDVTKPDVGTEAQRIERAKAAAMLNFAIRGTVFGRGQDAVNAMKEIELELKETLPKERSLEVQAHMKKALQYATEKMPY